MAGSQGVGLHQPGRPGRHRQRAALHRRNAGPAAARLRRGDRTRAVVGRTTRLRSRNASACKYSGRPASSTPLSRRPSSARAACIWPAYPAIRIRRWSSRTSSIPPVYWTTASVPRRGRNVEEVNCIHCRRESAGAEGVGSRSAAIRRRSLASVVTSERSGVVESEQAAVASTRSTRDTARPPERQRLLASVAIGQYRPGGVIALPDRHRGQAATTIRGWRCCRPRSKRGVTGCRADGPHGQRRGASRSTRWRPHQTRQANTCRGSHTVRPGASVSGRLPIQRC